MSNKNPKGFSGLSQLHSRGEAQVDPVESDFQSETPTDTITAPTPETESSSKNEKTVNVGSEPEVTLGTQQDEPQEGNKSGVSWGYIFWFLLIAGIFIAISQDYDSPSSVPKASTSSSTSPKADNVQTPSTSQIGSSSNVEQNIKPNETPKPQFSKPPIGSNNILSVSQISWCTRESMRIEAMRNVFDTNGGIGEFNKIVDDYNSRCSNYRYRQGDLSRAKRVVEKSRVTIISEATREAELIDQRFKKNANSSKENSRKPPAHLTREVQQLLTSLGYQPGPIDGDYGRGTANAIMAFQRYMNIKQDGLINQSLVSMLRQAVAKKNTQLTPSKPNQRSNNGLPENAHVDIYGTGWDCDRGYRKSGSQCLKVNVPANAHIDVYGSGWDCDRGYRKSGSQCLKVNIPANAHIDVYGSGWDCDRGYRKSGSQCLKVNIPANAHIDVYGSGWDCDRGYRKSGSQCLKVNVPANAHIDVYGSGWDCDRGYKKSGSTCEPI
ncbi:hypothetical protein J0V14_004404 [Vibrio parahaemolyticus]|nr:hypothetical protein [Vibrio parahaemolyticus]